MTQLSNHTLHTSACILAGGLSSRMGQDKGLMDFAHPLNQSTLAMAKHVAHTMTGCEQIFINSNQNLALYKILDRKSVV